jgi:hypothetical protein
VKVGVDFLVEVSKKIKKKLKKNLMFDFFNLNPGKSSHGISSFVWMVWKFVASN